MGAIEVLERVAKVVLNYYGITKAELINPSRGIPLPRRRAILYYLAKQYDKSITDEVIESWMGGVITRSTICSQRNYYGSQIETGTTDMSREYRELSILLGKQIQILHIDVHDLSDSDLSDIKEVLKRRSLHTKAHKYELEIIERDVDRRLNLRSKKQVVSSK